MTKTIHKISVLSLALMSLAISSNAQWTRNSVSGVIYPTVSSDKIGIGTTAPSYQLDIKQDANCSFRIQSQTNGSSNLILSRSSAGGQNCLVNYKTGNTDLWKTGASGNDNFSIINGTGTTTLLINQSTGNVGIGTTAPANKLDVKGSTSTTASFNNTASSIDNVGVTGSCDNTPYYGVGVQGFGGYKGVWGEANVTGSDANFGVYGIAKNGQDNYGVYGATLSNLLGGTSWAVYASGNTYSTGTYSSSDAKLKKDVRPLTNAIDKINKLKPSTYTFKTDEYKYMGLPSEPQYGFIAQELETVFPELVKQVHQPIDNDSKKNGMLEFKAINYVELIPVLTQAIQEQQKQIEVQKAQIEELKNDNKNMKSCVESICNSSIINPATIDYTSKIGTTNEQDALFQNQPNPFNTVTVIRYAIAKGNAQIIIRDLNGNSLKSFKLSESGKGQVTVNANELSQGTYTYTLVVNDNAIDTKLMVVTK